MKFSDKAENLFNALRQSAKPKPVIAIEKLIRRGPDRKLCRINALAFAAQHKLNEEDVIGFVHAARLATSRSIFATKWVVSDSKASKLLRSNGISATPEKRSLRCIARQIEILETP